MKLLFFYSTWTFLNKNITVLSILQAKDELKLQYRYVDLRSSNLQQNLRLRSNIVMAMRKFLIDRAGTVDTQYLHAVR